MDEDVNRPPEEGTSPPDAKAMEQPTARLHLGSPEARLGAVVALALVAGLVVWLLVRGNDNSTPTHRTSAQAVSAQDLAALPTTVGHPVYWAGPSRAFTYELTRTSDGRIYIRYLPAGVSIGSNQPKYLTIGTYPVQNAFAAVRGIAKGLRLTAMKLNGGGAAVQDTKHPTSVYFAYPGSDYQVEVYDPSPARALQLVVSGKIIPLESTKGPTQPASARPKAATLQQLRALESSVGHAVYWVGPRAGVTYELTRTGDSRIYIRYLPSGTKVDDQKPQTTVGTYPFPNPVAAVKSIAKETGGRTFSVAGGGLAAVDGNHPTSVYVAFPGSNYQIEVFDPSAARARRLVSSGLVVPVR
jgi:hypothetical protein